jgi:hypothetical protein
VASMNELRMERIARLRIVAATEMAKAKKAPREIGHDDSRRTRHLVAAHNATREAERLSQFEIDLGRDAVFARRVAKRTIAALLEV